MRFLKLSGDSVASGKTMLDNAFIREYLPTCPENFCKVYLYGLYLLNRDDADLSDLCKALSLSEEDVQKAYSYFEEYGIVEIVSKDPLSVEYRSVPAGKKPKKIRAGKYQDFCREVQALLPGRMITPSEFNEYFNLIETYGFEPEALILIIKYCTLVKDSTVSYKYITTVAQNWAAKGLLTLDLCETELMHYRNISGEIGEVLKALGIKSTDRDITTLYGKWTKELGFSHEIVLFAARTAKKSKGGVERLDELLLELFKNKKFSEKEIKSYFDSKDSAKDCALRINRALGVYVQRLDTEIETYVLPWSDYGFSPDVLEKLAVYCYRGGISTLEGMNSVIQSLFQKGILSEESIDAYLERKQKTDAFLQKILDLFRLSRNVNSYDRTNLSTWRNWGFSDEGILAACERCKSEYHPFREVHRLLAYCMEHRIYAPEEITRANSKAAYVPKQNFSQRDYSREELNALFANDED